MEVYYENMFWIKLLREGEQFLIQESQHDLDINYCNMHKSSVLGIQQQNVEFKSMNDATWSHHMTEFDCVVTPAVLKLFKESISSLTS